MPHQIVEMVSVQVDLVKNDIIMNLHAITPETLQQIAILYHNSGKEEVIYS
jgi:hypothetical protein